MVGVNRLIDEKRAEIGDLKMTPHLYLTHAVNNAGEFFFLNPAVRTTLTPAENSDIKPIVTAPEAKAATAPEVKTGTINAAVPAASGTFNSPASSAKIKCEREFVAKKSSGDLGQNPDEQGFLSWCKLNPSPYADKQELDALINKGAHDFACKAEFLAKKSSGDLGKNPDESGFLAWCARNP
jgi:hypothetical protein